MLTMRLTGSMIRILADDDHPHLSERGEVGPGIDVFGLRVVEVKTVMRRGARRGMHLRAGYIFSDFALSSGPLTPSPQRNSFNDVK